MNTNFNNGCFLAPLISQHGGTSFGSVRPWYFLGLSSRRFSIYTRDHPISEFTLFTQVFQLNATNVKNEEEIAEYIKNVNNLTSTIEIICSEIRFVISKVKIGPKDAITTFTLKAWYDAVHNPGTSTYYNLADHHFKSTALNKKYAWIEYKHFDIGISKEEVSIIMFYSRYLQFNTTMQLYNRDGRHSVMHEDRLWRTTTDETWTSMKNFSIWRKISLQNTIFESILHNLFGSKVNTYFNGKNLITKLPVPHKDKRNVTVYGDSKRILEIVAEMQRVRDHDEFIEYESRWVAELQLQDDELEEIVIEELDVNTYVFEDELITKTFSEEGDAIFTDNLTKEVRIFKKECFCLDYREREKRCKQVNPIMPTISAADITKSMLSKPDATNMWASNVCPEDPRYDRSSWITAAGHMHGDTKYAFYRHGGISPHTQWDHYAEPIDTSKTRRFSKLAFTKKSTSTIVNHVYGTRTFTHKGEEFTQEYLKSYDTVPVTGQRLRDLGGYGRKRSLPSTTPDVTWENQEYWKNADPMPSTYSSPESFSYNIEMNTNGCWAVAAAQLECRSDGTLYLDRLGNILPVGEYGPQYSTGLGKENVNINIKPNRYNEDISYEPPFEYLQGSGELDAAVLKANPRANSGRIWVNEQLYDKIPACFRFPSLIYNIVAQAEEFGIKYKKFFEEMATEQNSNTISRAWYLGRVRECLNGNLWEDKDTYYGPTEMPIIEDEDKLIENHSSLPKNKWIHKWVEPHRETKDYL